MQRSHEEARILLQRQKERQTLHSGSILINEGIVKDNHVETFAKGKLRIVRPPWVEAPKRFDMSAWLQKFGIQFDSANVSLGLMRLKNIQTVVIDGGTAKAFEFAEPTEINGHLVSSLFYREGRVVGATFVYDDAWSAARKVQ